MFVFAPSLFWKSVNKPLTLYFLQSRQETLLRLDLKKKKAMQISRLTRPLEQAFSLDRLKKNSRTRKLKP